MVAAADNDGWRKALAIGVLSLAALGVAGCDDSETGSDEGVEQETPAGSAPATADDDMAPTEGEGPAEDEDPDAEDDTDT